MKRILKKAVGCLLAALLLIITGCEYPQNTKTASRSPSETASVSEVSSVSKEISENPPLESSENESSTEPESSENQVSEESETQSESESSVEPDVSEESETSEEQVAEPDWDDEKEKGVRNILLIGADDYNGSSSRSDTMIVLSINEAKNKLVFTSLMRDTYVSIRGYRKNRLNAAYAIGGTDLLIDTIERNFGIRIDNYARVDFSSFVDAIDAIGGIDLIINDVNIEYFKKNHPNATTDGSYSVHLNGEGALWYARSRNFSDGDFSRTAHQRDLLIQFFRNCKGKTLAELKSVADSVLPYSETDISALEIADLLLKVPKFADYKLRNACVPCKGGYKYSKISGMSVLEIDFEKNREYLQTEIYG